MVQVKIAPYAQPLAIPYRWAKGEHHERCGLIVRMVDEAGHVGYGECAPPPHEPVDGPAFSAEGYALLDGLDLTADDFLAQLDTRDPAPRLRCGISAAWLSLRAAAAGQPLARFLGGPDRGISSEVPINDLITDATPQAAVARAQEAMARGQTTLKIKCTDDRPLDVARVGAIRAALPDATIRLDPNEAWQPVWVQEALAEMAQFGIDYIEQPLSRTVPLEVYAEVSAAAPIPIALDDSVRSLDHARRIIALRAAQVMILKAPRLGGPDKTLEVIDEAAAAGIRCVVTASLETAVGLYVALHCGALLPAPVPPCGLGTARFFARDVAEPPPIVDGAMAVPQTPGLGVGPVSLFG